MPHTRLRRFNTATLQKQPSGGAEMCMAVRAGTHIVLRGQGGFTLDGVFTGLGNPAAQADQAMCNVKLLLGDAGAGMEHIRRMTVYVTDRAWLNAVRSVLARHLAENAPATSELIVAGLLTPELLVEIDVEAAVGEP